MPVTEHVLATVTIKWAPDGLNHSTEDEKMVTNIFLVHCWPNALEDFPTHPFE